ncbi:MAG: CPBP family glutamic-type intramembrane protease [Planctomycetota bacterium]
MGLFVVLPLWVTYEILRLLVVPDRYNGAEVLFYRLPPVGLSLLTMVFGLTVLGCAWSILKRDIPWVRVGLVTILEGLVYGLIIGPLAGALTSYSTSAPAVAATAAPVPASELTQSLVGALGAGLYEELLFRLLLLSLLAWLFTRTTTAFGLPRWPGVLVAMVISSLLFALLHHVGEELPHVDRRVFLFRTMAGLILAVLFVFRGIGVCVYTHALYNVHFYLVQD